MPIQKDVTLANFLSHGVLCPDVVVISVVTLAKTKWFFATQIQISDKVSLYNFATKCA